MRQYYVEDHKDSYISDQDIFLLNYSTRCKEFQVLSKIFKVVGCNVKLSICKY